VAGTGDRVTDEHERAADLGRLSRRPADARVLAWLRAMSTPLTEMNRSPLDIDGFELHVHPDLIERITAAAREVPGASPIAVLGFLGVDCGGRLIAVATGTSGFFLRLDALPPGPPAIPSRPVPELGAGWLAVDPWLPEVTLPEAVPLLARCLSAAAARVEGRAPDA
jgi:hypothetical protein